jgi:hypothetical protein
MYLQAILCTFQIYVDFYCIAGSALSRVIRISSQEQTPSSFKTPSFLLSLRENRLHFFAVYGSEGVVQA